MPRSLLTSTLQIRTIGFSGPTSSWSRCATTGLPSSSRERLKAALSAAEGLLLQPRGEGELIELSDDEAVAAAVMLPMVAADRLAPSASSHTGGRLQAQCARDRLSDNGTDRPLSHDRRELCRARGEPSKGEHRRSQTVG